MKQTVFFLNCIISVLLLSIVAFAYPEVGHQFYGYAGSGTTITATVGSLAYISTVQSDGYYGYNTLFFVDAQTDDISGAEEGDTIIFSLDNTQISTYIFSVGGVTKLDFADDPATATVETTGTNTSSSSNTSSDNANSDTSSGDDSDNDSDSSSRSSRKKSSSSSTNEEAEDCSHKWTCTSWNACEENGFQTRTCYYAGDCTQEGNQSDTRQRCTYVAPEEEPVIEEEEPTCYDGIQNQGERGKDCGGPCDACQTTTPVIVEEPKTNWVYIGLAIFLIVLIIAIILAHKYKDKLMPYWIKFKSKLGIKTAPVVVTQTIQRPIAQRPAMQYPQYQQQYKPQYPPVKK